MGSVNRQRDSNWLDAALERHSAKFVPSTREQALRILRELPAGVTDGNVVKNAVHYLLSHSEQVRAWGEGSQEYVEGLCPGNIRLALTRLPSNEVSVSVIYYNGPIAQQADGFDAIWNSLYVGGRYHYSMNQFARPSISLGGTVKELEKLTRNAGPDRLNTATANLISAIGFREGDRPSYLARYRPPQSESKVQSQVKRRGLRLSNPFHALTRQAFVSRLISEHKEKILASDKRILGRTLTDFLKGLPDEGFARRAVSYIMSASARIRPNADQTGPLVEGLANSGARFALTHSPNSGMLSAWLHYPDKPWEDGQHHLFQGYCVAVPIGQGGLAEAITHSVTTVSNGRETGGSMASNVIGRQAVASELARMREELAPAKKGADS